MESDYMSRYDNVLSISFCVLHLQCADSSSSFILFVQSAGKNAHIQTDLDYKGKDFAASVKVCALASLAVVCILCKIPCLFIHTPPPLLAHTSFDNCFFPRLLPIQAINPDIVNESGTWVASYLQSVTKSIALGGEMLYQYQGRMEDAGFSLAGRYRSDTSTFTANASAMGQIVASYAHKVNDKVWHLYPFPRPALCV